MPKEKEADQAGSEENVKVAVRVRPFNKREIERNAKLVVQMQGNQTILRDPTGADKDAKKFAYDFSYWSHDGGKERSGDGYWEPDSKHPNGDKYADQKRVFEDLGKGILKNTWGGYNSTLFAYGQTGSGKSYSVVGYNSNKGIVPVFCEKLFESIAEKKMADTNTQFEVMFSMLEIYNEVIRDLLNPKGDKKNGLRLREHPSRGFYAEKLTVVPVDSYQAIEEQMTEGTTNRTIAATNMNATSSRAHTIVGIQFVQKTKNAGGEEMSKTSVTNLVDLAGSERVASTGATGDRLKEGAAINLSLTALGNCISALADDSQGKKVKVPYRDAVLTRLLMNALGGNSKTIMIAAISPADINYEETLSTLRYADRAKQIKTKAVVNENPTDKLIRELQEENKRLLSMLKDGGVSVGGQPGMSDAEREALRKQIQEEYKAQLEENERQVGELKKSFEEKLKNSNPTASFNGKSFKDLARQRQKYPHLYNLNMDTQLNGVVCHIIRSGEHKVGNQKGGSDIVMLGPSMCEQHAVIKAAKNHVDVTLEKAHENAKILVNGAPLVGVLKLKHNDRVLFGSTQLYVFACPAEAAKQPGKEYPTITYEQAQEEIAGNSGFNVTHYDGKSEADIILQDEILEVMPAVEEANSISEALDKMTRFEMVLVASEAEGRRSEVYVRVRNFINGLQYDWPKAKFMNRFYLMQEMYENFEDGQEWRVSLDRDPFIENLDDPVRIGTVNIYLKSLAYLIETKAQLEVIDIRGNEVGLLNIEVSPCDPTGKDVDEQSDIWIDNPNDLINKELHFSVKIHSARGLPPRFTDVFCQFKVFRDATYSKTEPMPDTNNPNFNYRKVFSFRPITQEFLDYLMNDRICIELWGLQMPITRDVSMNTRGLMQSEMLAKGQVAAANTNQKVIDMGRVKNQMEVEVLKKRQEKMEQKMHCLREMVTYGEDKNVQAVPLNYLKGVLDAPSNDTLTKWLNLFQRVGMKEMNGIVKSGSAGGSKPSSANRISSKSGACLIS